jgi:hypothetical protein
MDGFQPNVFAIVTAAFAGFVIGGLWFSPLLFGRRWLEAAGLTEEQVNASNKGKIFGLTALALFVMSVCLAMFIGPGAAAGSLPVVFGAFYGFLTGFGWLFFAFVVVGLFELRSRSWMLINGGYWVVTMTIMGAILAAMH